MKIDDIAKKLHQSARGNQPFVLLLGAGASISSGIPTLAEMCDRIIEEYPADYSPSHRTKAQKITAIWTAHSGLKEEFGEKFLTAPGINPSEGYSALARLIRNGYFNPIFTLNFDTLLEDSLKAIDVDTEVLFRGEESDQRLIERLEAKDGRVKILKLHKPYDRDDFLFIAGQLLDYPEAVKQTLHYFFRKNILVCGCSLTDMCVTNAFIGIKSKQDSFYYVSPQGFEGADEAHINSIITRRHVVEVAGDDGDFDRFFRVLWDAAFAISVRSEFPYPIAKSYSVLLNESPLPEKIKALHQLFENMMRFICCAFLADYRSLGERSSAHSHINPLASVALEDLSLANAIEFNSQFALRHEGARYPPSSKPFFRFCIDRLEDIEEAAQRLSADADEQAYTRRFELVFDLLKELEFLRACRLTARLVSPLKYAEIALNGDALMPGVNVDPMHGPSDFLTGQFRLYLEFHEAKKTKKGLTMEISRAIVLDPFAILTDVATENDGLIGNFCLYRAKGTKGSFQYSDLEGSDLDMDIDEERWSERYRRLVVSVKTQVTGGVEGGANEGAAEAYEIGREITGTDDAAEIGKALRALGLEVAVGSAAMSVNERIRRHLRAQYKLLFVLSYEEDRVLGALASIAQDIDQNLYSWSFHKGLLDRNNDPLPERIENAGQVIDWCVERDEQALFVLKDFHWFLGDPLIVRKVRDAVVSFKGKHKSLVFLSPVNVLPRELERDVTLMSYPLPQYEELNDLLSDIIASRGVKESYFSPDEAELDQLQKLFLHFERRAQLVNGCRGLTLLEAQNLFSKAISKRGGIFFDSIAEIVEEKEQMIKKSGVLEFFNSPERFESVGGLENLKHWLGSRGQLDGLGVLDLPSPKGILLTGVPGCGKSLCAKAVAAEWNVPLLRLDLGRIFGGRVGESEANLRESIAVAEAAAPCVLWIDEIEKGFSDAWGGSTGVTSRVFGSFLTWMQEKTSSVFVVATANDISSLPAEFLRKGRFDEIFFIDFPDRKEREDIFRIHLTRRKRDPNEFPVQKFAAMSMDYSGAEIEQVIVSALFEAFNRDSELKPDYIERSIRETIPLAKTASAEVGRIRNRAQLMSARPASLYEEPVLSAGR